MDTYARISTPDFSTEVIDQLNEQISALNTEIADQKLGNKTLVTRITNLQSTIDSMIERLMELVESDEIDNDVAQDLASFFGRDLVRTVSVRITVDIDAEVTVPVGYDLDDLSGDIDIDVTPSYSSDVQIDVSDISSVEVEES
jgi:sugar-specific transcriptional regulator TrmB